MLDSLMQLLPEIPDVKVVDVGASNLGEIPPYQPLFHRGRGELVGFEPDPDQLAKLQAVPIPRQLFLGDALGDGQEATLHICKIPGMTSLLEPDPEVLAHFHGFAEWAEVLRKEPLQTRRLDDVPEARDCHYLKLDVQGSELPILAHGREVLRDCLFVHIEVQFVPFYKDQPLFAELDQLLREAGFWLHRFLPIKSRVFKPLLVNDDIYAGLSQQLWSDAVYVRRFVDFPSLDVEDLQRIALIAHDVYKSLDLASLALVRLDERDGGKRQPRYLQALSEAPS